MKQKIGYYGWLGHNNTGDEAAYLANKQLFNEYELVPFCKNNDSNVTLLGGCTMLPSALVGWRGEHQIKKRKINYGIGLGIQDPEFHNRRCHRIDVTWAAGRLGFHLNQALGRLRYIWPAINIANNKLGRPLNLGGYYILDQDFEKIRKFGFDRIGVRGPVSQEILQRYGIASTIVGDTVLYLEPTAYHYDKSHKIAISIRDKGPKWENTTNYLKELILFCNSISDAYRFIVLPIYPPDMELGKKLNREINNSILLDFTTNIDVRGLLDEISSCDLMIGEKLHANVLSACCHVPFISIEYDPKSYDFVCTLGLEELNIRIDKVTYEKLEELFNKAIDNQDIIDRLKQNVETIRKKLESFADVIKTDIEHELRV